MKYLQAPIGNNNRNTTVMLIPLSCWPLYCACTFFFVVEPDLFFDWHSASFEIDITFGPGSLSVHSNLLSGHI